MNGKGFKSSNLAVAIATSLAVNGVMTPTLVHGKATSDVIVGTGVNAIIGTGKDAIIGTGVNAIIGTGKDAIIGTGKDAIIGTGKDAIIGTGKDAIIGTGVNAIIGTGKDAIIGTGKRVVVLTGPIDGVDTATDTVSVLNRTLKLRTAQSVHDALAGGQQLMVSVTGQLTTTGKLEQLRLSFLPASYVAGASKVILSGRVDRVDSELGRIQIGGVMVDVTAAAGSAQRIAVGNIVLLVGTQPTRQGVVIAEQIYSK